MSRRALLVGGLGVGVLGVAGVVTDVLPGGPRVRRFLGMTGQEGAIPDVPAGPVVTTRIQSGARGREVTVITMAPHGFAADELPKCVALHGRGGDAHWMVDLGVPQFLTAAVRAGVPPFAVVSPDGGADSYWVEHDGDDPQRMLAEELGPIQAALGISMGAFGALRLARGRELEVVAVASPALYRDWSDAAGKGVFTSRAQWEADEPLRHVGELSAPVGVWCGTEDPFVDAARQLVAEARPAHAAITSGAHEVSYWRRVLPEMIAFAGPRLAAP
ncbi:MAG: esterase [Kibdelosporangium sp.]